MTLAYDSGVVWAAWYEQRRRRRRRMGLFVRTIYPALGPIIKAPESTSTDGGTLSTQPGRRDRRPQRRRDLLRLLRGLSVLRQRRAVEGRQLPGAQGPRVGRRRAGGHLGRRRPAGCGSPGTPRPTRSDAVRTNTNGERVRRGAAPAGAEEVPGRLRPVIEGTRARADIVFNDGTAIWHQQVFVGLTLKAEAGPVDRLARREDQLQGHRRRRRRPGGDGQGQVERQQAHLQDRRQREVQDHLPEDGQEQDQGERHEGGLRPGRDEAQGQLRFSGRGRPTCRG